MSEILINRLTEEEQVIYDWQYERNGSFRQHLMEAISRADWDNLEKLRKGFPIHVRAYERFAHERGWWESVQKRLTERGSL